MPKKKDLIEQFIDSLNTEQIGTIQTLLNRTPSRKSLIILFTKTFKRTISIATRKSKSRELQKWVCEQISKLLGIPWGKDEEIASREMGQSGTDIRLSPKIKKLFMYDSECKDDASWNIKKAIEQAKLNTGFDRNWIVFHRQTTRNPGERVDTVAIIDANHFFELQAKIKELENTLNLYINPPKLIRR